MSITIVVPVRDRQDELSKCLKSIEKSIHHYKKFDPDRNAEIIVVDDRSNCDLLPFVSGFQHTKLINNNGSGPGAARNTGLRAAQEDLVAFIDSDCTASENWLAMIDCEMSQSKAFALQGDPCRFKKINKLGLCEEKLYLGMFSRYIKEDECTQIDTRNCAFRKDILTMYPEGPFIDDMKQAQAEARVAGNRLKSDGVAILYSHNVIVYHIDPKSIRQSMRQKYRHGSGRIYVWEKCPAVRHLLSRYFLKPILDYKVPFWYVIPTHLAFLYGYMQNRYRREISE